MRVQLAAILQPLLKDPVCRMHLSSQITLSLRRIWYAGRKVPLSRCFPAVWATLPCMPAKPGTISAFSNKEIQWGLATHSGLQVSTQLSLFADSTEIVSLCHVYASGLGFCTVRIEAKAGV